MHLLYLAHRIPYPPNKGDKIRSFNEIKYLSKNHEIDLICLADNIEDLKFEKNLKRYCNRVSVQYFNTVQAKIKGLFFLLADKPISVGYFWRRKMQCTLNEWMLETQYDAIICFSSPMAEYVFRSQVSQPSNLKSPRPLLIIDFCDLDSDKWRQYSEHTRFPLSQIYRWESKRLMRYEKKINQEFDYSIFVSDSEANLFYMLFPEAKNVHIIPNGVDTHYFSNNYGNQPIQHTQLCQPNSKDPKFNIKNQNS